MPRVDLRHTHPMFFVSVLGDLALWIGVGLALAIGPAEWASSAAFDPARTVMPMRAWSAPFLAIGVMLLYGIGRSWRWARRSMLFGAALTAGFATSATIAAVTGNAGGIGAVVWVDVLVNLMAKTGEPPLNPASAR